MPSGPMAWVVVAMGTVVFWGVIALCGYALVTSLRARGRRAGRERRR